MFIQNHAVQTGGNVDWHVDVDLFARVKLRAEQIEAKLRMKAPFFRKVIMPAMMALCEQRDGIHVAGLQRVLPFIFVKGQSDSRNRRRCMEIQMNLSKTQVMHKTSSMPVNIPSILEWRPAIIQEKKPLYNKIPLLIKTNIIKDFHGKKE